MSQITTHILDTSLGKPASDVKVTLSAREGGEWQIIGSGVTNDDGRVEGLVDQDQVLPSGQLKLNFETSPYFVDQNIDAFYPFVEIVFAISGDGQHYHVPLLLNPFGYSTYRGS